MSAPTRPTHQRYYLVLAATLMAVLLYLDRFCISIVEIYIKQGLNLTDDQIGWILGAFFYTYALGQVPAGWLSDRFGGRTMLTIYILTWSIFTGLIGLASGFVALLLFRAGFGFGQAGAYPTAANLISKWVPFTTRGTASSIVAMGGRVGGALAPLLTALLLVAFVPVTVSSLLAPRDLMSVDLAYEITLADHLPEEDRDSNQNVRAAVGQRALELLPPEAAETLRDFGRRVAELKQASANASGSAKSKIDEQRQALRQQFDEARPQLVEAFNGLLANPNLYAAKTFPWDSLPQQAKFLIGDPESPSTQLSSDEQTRLNRLLLESAFPEIRKVYGESWREVMFLYAALGLGVAAFFWWVVRDEPRLHPRCNEAELAVIEYGRPATVAAASGRAKGLPMRAILTSFNMWMTSISQFTTNVGWVFLTTWLARYLDEVHRVPIEQRGFYMLLPMTLGWPGMLLGGPLTDVLARKLGLRWGRALPMGLSRFTAMAGYLICLLPYFVPGLELPLWVYVAAFALVAFSTDLGISAVWAFQQDIAGKHVGSALGWGNMWGNFGAAIASSILLVPSRVGWDGIFMICAAAFFISGVAALLIDARVPLRIEPDEAAA